MKILKYIITNKDIPVLFGQDIIHNQILVNQEVISAGFVMISLNKTNLNYDVVCYGESSSLKIKSNSPRDEQLIKELIAINF